MVAVGPNMFYTVTLPCTLWFLDRDKAKSQRAHTVLFIDARHIYRQVDRAHRDWMPAQIGFIANLARLYRGEAPDLLVAQPRPLCGCGPARGGERRGFQGAARNA